MPDPPSDPPTASKEEFREALSYWPTGVSVVAVRDEGRVEATTVGSLTSVSDNPPTVAVSLTASASILPFLSEGTRFGISILAPSQRRIAAVYADSFPVGPHPFGKGAVPLIEGSLVGLVCRVTEVKPVSRSYLILSAVEGVVHGKGSDPLIYFRRGYRTLKET